MSMAIAVAQGVLGAALVLVGALLLALLVLHGWAVRVGGEAFAERLFGGGCGRDDG
jgi:hypothetical protein